MEAYLEQKPICPRSHFSNICFWKLCSLVQFYNLFTNREGLREGRRVEGGYAAGAKKGGFILAGGGEAKARLMSLRNPRDLWQMTLCNARDNQKEHCPRYVFWNASLAQV